MRTRVISNVDGIVDEKDIRIAADILRGGGLVSFPTETVYGLGADGMSDEAVRSIFRAKGRPSDNPLILHISSLDQLKDVTIEIADSTKRIIKHFWPGPLTLVLESNGSIPPAVNSGLSTVAVRMPDNDIALAFISACGLPVAAPSANISGKPSPTTAKDVLEDMDGKIDCIIDGGPCKIGVESTVLDMTSETPVILRPGGVSKEEIEEIGVNVEINSGSGDLHEIDIPKAPGMKYRHYAPNAKVVLFEGSKTAAAAAISREADRLLKLGYSVGIAAPEGSPAIPQIDIEKKKSYIVADDNTPTVLDINRQISVKHEAKERLIHKIMGDPTDPFTIAARLFSLLRSFDRDGVDYILVEGIAESGVGFAIMNRLRKAAGHNIVRC